MKGYNVETAYERFSLLMRTYYVSSYKLCGFYHHSSPGKDKIQ